MHEEDPEEVESTKPKNGLLMFQEAQNATAAAIHATLMMNSDYTLAGTSESNSPTRDQDPPRSISPVEQVESVKRSGSRKLSESQNLGIATKNESEGIEMKNESEGIKTKNASEGIEMKNESEGIAIDILAALATAAAQG